MKKLILVLAVLLTVPAFGALSISLTQQGTTNLVDLTYAGADTANLPRAFALNIEVTSPAKITDVTNFKIGESNSTKPGFGIYPARIVIDGTGTVTAWGTPLADEVNDPGAAGTGIGTNKVVLEFGSLYVGDGNAPAASGTLCTLTMDCNGATGNVNIVATEENTYRGGVVLEDGTAPSPDLTASLVYACAPPECVKSTAPFYSVWVQFGKPNCWCYQRNCRGDVDGLKQLSYWVFTADLTALKAAFGAQDGDLTGTKICSDLDRAKQLSYRVFTADLTILKSYFALQEASVPVCDMTNYNFWTN